MRGALSHGHALSPFRDHKVDTALRILEAEFDTDLEHFALSNEALLESLARNLDVEFAPIEIRVGEVTATDMILGECLQVLLIIVPVPLCNLKGRVKILERSLH